MCTWSLPSTQQACSNFARAAGTLLSVKFQIASGEEDKQLNICRSEWLTTTGAMHLMLPVGFLQA